MSDYAEERDLGANGLNVTDTFTSRSGNITYTAFKVCPFLIITNNNNNPPLLYFVVETSA